MKHIFTRSALFGLASASVLGTAALALSAGDQLGTTEAEIRDMLVAQGYTVDEIEAEDGGFEVEVMRDGTAFEIEVAASGEITEIELEDDEDDEDEEDDD